MSEYQIFAQHDMQICRNKHEDLSNTTYRFVEIEAAEKHADLSKSTMQARPPRICRKWNPALPAGSGAGSPGLSKPAGLRPVPVEKRRHDVPASVEKTPGSAEKRPGFVEYHARTCRGFTRNCRKHFQNGTGFQQVMPLQAAVYTLYVLFFLCRTSIYLFIDSFKKRVIRL